MILVYSEAINRVILFISIRQLHLVDKSLIINSNLIKVMDLGGVPFLFDNWDLFNMVELVQPCDQVLVQVKYI